MSAYPTLDYADEQTWLAIYRAWRLDLDPVRDPELGQFYGRTARYSIVDPYACEDDIIIFHATVGMGYTVQSGSYHDPFLLRIYDQRECVRERRTDNHPVHRHGWARHVVWHAHE